MSYYIKNIREQMINCYPLGIKEYLSVQ